MWCLPSDDLNQTVDTTRNYLKRENFSSFYWESSASFYRVTGDVWRQPSEWYLPWEKSEGSFRGWHASQEKQSSIWSALLDDVFGILHAWQVPVGVFWKLVLSVVILCKRYKQGLLVRILHVFLINSMSRYLRNSLQLSNMWEWKILFLF